LAFGGIVLHRLRKNEKRQGKSLGMKFIALDVKVGDSFILKEDGNNFVVDGGKDKNTIVPKLVENNNIVDIDVVICSHYDSDHLNGIIGIINSNRINIRELWLPDIFGDIALTLTQHPEFVLDLFKTDKPLEIETGITLENYTEKQEAIEQNDIDEPENISDISFLGYLWDKLERLCLYPLFPLSTVNAKHIITILKILELAIYAKYSGARIRWLKYEERLIESQVSEHYELYALNSCEKSLQVYKRGIFYYALYVLSQINRESLVFQFEKKGLPNVLFTADSDLDFCELDGIYLPNNSIITAPHHGSYANIYVYKILQGSDLIYVRSDQVTSKRPCEEYISLRNKYCTVCNTAAKRQQVTLEYNRNIKQWIPVNTSHCTCQLDKHRHLP
jgi:hypothetical protein